MYWILGIICMIGLIYILRYLFLTRNLRYAKKQLIEMKQNPNENRILLFSSPDKNAEELFRTMNEYIMTTRTQRIELENREKKLKAQIENVSHDLRTPLTSMMGYLELINVSDMDSEDLEAIEVIQRKARNLKNLIDNFYDLSRLETHDYVYTLEPLDLSSFIKEHLIQFFADFEKQRLSVDLKLPPNPVYVTADFHSMERIFNNMIQNVLRYAESAFCITLNQTADHVILSFCNDTNTLSPEAMPHLFDRFYVADHSRSKQGSGLGLTISKLLAETMGAEIDANLTDHWLEIKYTFR